MLDGFGKITSDVLIRVQLDGTQAEIMKGFRHGAGDYREFARQIETYPEVRERFLELVNQKLQGKVADPVRSVQAAMGFVGFTQARNFLVSSWLKSGNEFSVAGEGKAGADTPLGGDYFVAGFVFDLLRGVLVSQRETPEAVDRDLKEAWEHGIEVASAMTRLGAELKLTPAMVGDLCVDALLHDLGHVIARFIDPSLIDLPDGSHLAEKSALGVTHSSLGFLFLYRLGFLQETAWVTLYHHQPTLAEKIGKTAALRATLIWLGDSWARWKKNPSVPQQEIVGRWYQCCRSVLKIKEPEFRNLLTKL